ncbi:MAG TPA: hypothetical protein VHF25_04250 [Nitriliruptorales bacterium]|nr:hypothetical protein [Nitriliruptorales bacterium]
MSGDVEGAQRRKVVGQPADRELVEVSRTGEVLQPVLTQIAEPATIGQLTFHPRCDDL